MIGLSVELEIVLSGPGPDVGFEDDVATVCEDELGELELWLVGRELLVSTGLSDVV